MKSAVEATEQLLDEIEELKQTYRQKFKETDDPQLLKRVESCIGMQMKFYGINGREPAPCVQISQPEQTIDLSQIPQKDLETIIANNSKNINQSKPTLPSNRPKQKMPGVAFGLSPHTSTTPCRSPNSIESTTVFSPNSHTPP